MLDKGTQNNSLHQDYNKLKIYNNRVPRPMEKPYEPKADKK